MKWVFCYELVMDAQLEMEMSRDELIALVVEFRREVLLLKEENALLRKRIEELEGRNPTQRLGDSYSLQAERKRRDKKSGRRVAGDKLLELNSIWELR